VINGKINYVNDDWNYDVRIDGKYPDLGEWLKKFGFPPIATSAGGGEIRIHGTGKNAIVNVNAQLRGVPCLDTVDTEATWQGGVATFQITSGGLGGALRGEGVYDQGTKTIRTLHMLGAGLDASRVCGIGKHVTGTIEKAENDEGAQMFRAAPGGAGR